MYRRWPLVRQFKLNLLRFMRLRGTPEEVAKGLALGIFVGLTPTFGVQMILAVFLAMLLKENKIAAAIGVWITNPLTAPLIYALEYKSGRVLLDMERVRLPSELSLAALKSISWKVMLPLSVGSLLWGALGALTVYVAAIRLVPVVKTWRIARWPRRRMRP